jgi:hypothetical protein
MASSRNRNLFGAHIPLALRDPGIFMSSRDMATPPDVPTVFVGIINNDFNEETWNNCIDALRKLFNITKHYGEIKVLPSRDESSIVDSNTLGPSMTSALTAVNTGVFEGVGLRIVRIGPNSSLSVFEALESLLKGWRQDFDKKHIQFVTTGDSGDNENFNFCKWICIMRLCNTIEFYNTMDYNTYGFADLRHRDLQMMMSRMKQGNVTEILERMGGVIGSENTEDPTTTD